MTSPGSEAPQEVLRHARRLAEERDWPELARLDGSDTVRGVPELAYLVADACRRVGRAAEAIELAAIAEVGATRLCDRRLGLRTLNLRGMLAFESGSLEEAQARFDALLARAAELRDDEFVARASNNLGVIANVRGERELALTAYQRALAAYYRLGHSRGLAQTYYNLGISYRDLGFLDDAERHYVAAIRYSTMSRSDDVAALAETERAYLRAIRGDGPMAESMALLALRRHETMQDPVGCANAIRVLGIAAEASDNLEEARGRLEQALTVVREHDDPLLRAEILRDQGRILHRLGEPIAASAALHEAAETFAALGALAEVAATQALTLTPPSPPDR